MRKTRRKPDDCVELPLTLLSLLHATIRARKSHGLEGVLIDTPPPDNEGTQWDEICCQIRTESHKQQRHRDMRHLYNVLTVKP